MLIESQTQPAEQGEIDLLFMVGSGCIGRPWELPWIVWQHELARKQEQMRKHTDIPSL